MASYIPKRVKCQCCGHVFEENLLRGFFQNNAMGLDRNPHTPAVYDTIVLCPQCGYATRHLNKPVSEQVKVYVQSSVFCQLKESLPYNDPLSKFVLCANILGETGDFKSAADTYLMGHWYALDKAEATDAFLPKAIECYSHYLEKHQDIETAIVLIDCLRQAGRFDEANETAQSLQPYIKIERLQRIVSYELQLISSRDAKPHLVSEV